jgi:hypothetical protein
MSEDQRKHLEFVQTAIARMNTNSFQVKGTAVTIVSALLAVFASTQKVVFVALCAAPLFVFWFLDTYYLQKERKFRGIYNDLIGITNTVQVALYEMPIQKYKGGKYSFLANFTSTTILPLYLSLVALVAGAFSLLLCNGFKIF